MKFDFTFHSKVSCPFFFYITRHLAYKYLKYSNVYFFFILYFPAGIYLKSSPATLEIGIV